jgi:hypothetical protein
MDRVRVNASGEMIDVVTASRAPASPAHAALTTKASTRSRATFRPASAAAYAPMVMNAPLPSEIWPLSPSSTVSPATATT